MGSKKILVVDDSRTFRHLEEELLKRNGYALLQAENGAQALQVAARETPDLILLDLQMPVMDGAKALAALKSGDKTAGIPVVMITTLSEKGQHSQLLAAGAIKVLVKPLDAADLIDTIRVVLND
ncbi:MAG TPA: response regulator [Polyangiales bacterium]|nr:response regulator [Polyangiales bacterium]